MQTQPLLTQPTPALPNHRHGLLQRLALCITRKDIRDDTHTGVSAFHTAILGWDSCG